MVASRHGLRAGVAAFVFAVACQAPAPRTAPDASGAGANDTISLSMTIDAVEPLELVEFRRWGVLERPSSEVLARVTQIERRPGGGLFIWDAQADRLAIFAENGRWIRNVGRIGEGPGEFRSVDAMRLVGDSALVVWDASNLRVSWFDLDGGFSDAVPLRALTAREIVPVDDGRLYFRVRVPKEDPAGVAPPDAYIAFDGAEFGAGVVPLPPPDRSGPTFSVIFTDHSEQNPVVSTHAALSPTGALVSGRSDEYRLVSDDRTGTVRAQTVEGWETIRIGDEERSHLESLAASFAPVDPDTRYEIPESKPVFRGISVGRQGRVWVHLYAEAAPEPFGCGRRACWKEAPTYDVFGRDLGFVGRVTLKKNQRRLMASGDSVWVVERGPFDEPYVVLLVINGGSRPAPPRGG